MNVFLKNQRFTKKVFTLSYIITILMTWVTCKASPEPFESEGITSYSEATAWVTKSYKAETVEPDSSLIYKITYFRDGKFMLIHFQSNKRKSYLYHKVPSSLWTAFKSASSVGGFYKSRIKGNKSIYLKLDK